MFEPLTKKQKFVLDFISRFIEKNGYSPSLDEIREGLSLKAVSTVHEHINKLKEKGYLTKEMNQARGLNVMTQSEEIEGLIKIPIIGSIKKSLFSNVNKSSHFYFDPSITPSHKNLIAIKVEDDSLLSEGAKKGDILIIKKEEVFNSLSLVLINSTKNAVIRIPIEEKHSIRLVSQNKNIKERIYKNVEIVGSIVAMIRIFS